MASGGARGRSGPLPDPGALKRDRPADRAGWTSLPAEGRQGPAPAWPLDSDPSPRELKAWEHFWRKPQAVIWERDQAFEVVAMFVRHYLEGMHPKASAENRKTVRMMLADLYLTPDSLTRGHLRIATDVVQEKRAEKRAPSARDRLTVIDPIDPPTAGGAECR